MVATAVFFSAVETSLAAESAATAPVQSFDIKPQRLASALNAFALQSHQQILFTPEAVDEKTSQGVNGSLTADAALAQLLAGTGLVFSRSAERMFLVASPEDSAAVGATAASILLAQSAASESSNVPGESVQRGVGSITEIIVTAQKRTERLRDVPVPVTVINTEALANSNQLRLQDYYSKIPGVSLTANAGGAGFIAGNRPTVVIRGITTGGADNPTVGFLIDDVPYGATVLPSSIPATAPDVDPSDLARVEVLRGPQGTLYGASSLGGLVKYVTIEPSSDAVSGRLQVGSTSVHAGGVGHSVRGAVNLPLNETLAVRLSGFTLRDPGYVDNVLTGARDINKRESDGGRLSLLWRPSDAFSLKLNAIIQNNLKRGYDTADVSLGKDNFRYSAIPKTGFLHNRIGAYSANLIGKLGDVDLVSITGYTADEIDSRGDASPPAFGGLFGPLALNSFGVSGAAILSRTETEKFSQEIRASIPLGSRIDWLAGVFYTQEDIGYFEQQIAANPVTGETVGLMLDFTLPAKFDERAVFTNFDFNITSRLDVQIGGRLSKLKHTADEAVSAGPNARLFFGVDPRILPERNGDESAFTYLVTPRFKLSADLMMYARLASGYRPGGFNTNFGVPGVSNQWEHDTTRNYELGVKGAALSGALSFDASVYRIDWTDLPVNLTAQNGITPYTDNAGNARSQGVELSAEARPFTGTTIAGWVAFNDNEVTEPYNGQPAGSRLPFSSRWSGNLSVEQEFPVADNMLGFVGASASYVDDRAGIISNFPVFLPSYVQTDFHCGLRYEAWTVNAFVNNVTDKRGVLSGVPGVDAFLVFIQPRAVGVNLTREF